MDKNAATDYVKNSGGYIIQRKGATFYAISALVAILCQSLHSEQVTTTDLSTVLNGEYGIHDVALSLPTLISNNGVENKILLPLNASEEAALHASADTLKEIIKSLDLK